MKKVNCSSMTGFILEVIVCLLLAGQVARADVTFGRPTPIGHPVNNETTIVGACISADGLEAYFDSFETVPGFGLKNIMIATRATTADDWGNATLLGSEINSTSMEVCPRISADGLELYFTSYRSGRSDIYIARRQSPNAPWERAENLVALNGSDHDHVGSLSLDGLELYYNNGDFLRVATRATKNSAWKPTAFPGPTINSVGAALSPDGLCLIFSSDSLPSGIGDLDLWMARRVTREANWGTPVNLGRPINSSDIEYRPLITYDSSTLLFGSGGPFTSGRKGGYGLGDIWQASIMPGVDFSGDGKVDINDLTILIEHWGQNDPFVDMGPRPFGDSIIDVHDLEVLMDHWGQEAYDPNLLAHWKLDETEGDVAYDSAATNDTAVMGDAIWQPDCGQIDGALQFDGIDDYIETPGMLNPADGVFSVFAWVKGVMPGQVIISQEDSADWLLADTQGYLMTALKSGGRRSGAPLISEMTITDDNWHWVGFTWDGSNRTLYVDDIVVAEDSLSNLAGASGGLRIGTGSNLEPGTFWSGLIDDVRIYDRVVKP